MPFKLYDTLPEDIDNDYWCHNSAGEHAMKHLSDPAEIDQLRQRRGLEAFNGYEMYERLHAGGIVTVRNVRNGNPVAGADGIAGYVVADVHRSGRVLDVQDLFVAEANRGKSIAGYVLGKLISSVYMHYDGIMMRADYGKTLSIAGTDYKLPGTYVETDRERFTDETFARFLGALPADWRGIRQVRSETGVDESFTVYDGGQPVAELEHAGYGKVRIQGEATEYETAPFAAIAALNR